MTAGGLVIGRGGSIIKEICETSHCKVNLGNDKDMFGTQERVLTIRGSKVADVIKVCIEI